MTLPTHMLLDGDTLPATMIGTVFAETFIDEHGVEQGRYPSAHLVALPVEWYTRPMRWTGNVFTDDVAEECVRLTAVAKASRDLEQISGCMSPKGRVNTDPGSQLKINTFYSVALGAKALGRAFAVAWSMESGSPQMHSADDMILLGGAIAVFMDTVHQTYLTKKNALTTATTLEELWAIVPRT